MAWWIRRRAPQPARQPSTSDDPFGDALDAAGGMFEEIHSYAGPFGDGLEFALADQPGIDAAYVWDRDERDVVRLTGDRLIRSPGAAAPAGGTGPAAAPRASA